MRNVYGAGTILATAVLVILFEAGIAGARPTESYQDERCGSCHGNAPTLDATPDSGSTLDFGSVLVGEMASRMLSATNTGSSKSGLTGNFPAASGEFGPQTADQFDDGNPSHYPQLNRNETESRSYTYTPTSRGSDSRSVTMTSNGGNATITLSGRGVAPVCQVDSAGADLGNIRIGTSGMASLTVRNTGDGNDAGAGKGNLLGSVGALSGDFTGSGGSMNLPDGGSKQFNFALSPGEHTAYSQNVAVQTTNGSDDGTNQAQTIQVGLSGTGVGPMMGSSITPDSLIDFGIVDNASMPLSISNLTIDPDLGSLTDLTLLSATITGPDAGLFSLVDFSADTVLSKGESADFFINFAPLGQTEPAEALLSLVTDQGAAFGSPGDVLSFPLTGAALVPEPGTAPLFLMGLAAGMMWYRRRRTRR